MQMRFNRRGQEGFSTTGVLAMIVGVIALVVIGIFIYNAYSAPKKISELVPEKFTLALATCDQLKGQISEDVYCNNFIEFDVGSALTSRFYYYNCADLEKQVGKNNTRCADVLRYAKIKCLNLALAGEIDDGDTVYVSDRACKYIAPTSTGKANLTFLNEDLANVTLYPQFAQLA